MTDGFLFVGLTVYTVVVFMVGQLVGWDAAQRAAQRVGKPPTGRDLR